MKRRGMSCLSSGVLVIANAWSARSLALCSRKKRTQKTLVAPERRLFEATRSRAFTYKIDPKPAWASCRKSPSNPATGSLSLYHHTGRSPEKTSPARWCGATRSTAAAGAVTGSALNWRERLRRVVRKARGDFVKLRSDAQACCLFHHFITAVYRASSRSFSNRYDASSACGITRVCPMTRMKFVSPFHRGTT